MVIESSLDDLHPDVVVIRVGNDDVYQKLGLCLRQLEDVPRIVAISFFLK